MTLKGHKQLPRAQLELMAKLMQLHLETHPNRIGRRWGVSGNYIRQLWRETCASTLSRQEIERAIHEYFQPAPHAKRD